MMSENTLKLHRNRIRYQFVRSSFNAVLQDSQLHEVWWQADTLLDEINTRCQLQDDLKVKKSELLRVVGKEYHEKSIEGNIFVGGGGEQLKLFRHDFKAREDGKQQKYDFFQVSVKDVPHSYPTASNSVAWKEQNASHPLPPRTRQHVDFTTSSSSQFFSAVPGPVNTKKRKLASDQANKTQIEQETTPTSSLLILTAQEPSPQLSSYWESGDSRKLFAPKLYYGTDCDVRKAVMDRIEKLEMVNSIAADWRTLVDGGDQEDLCSEHDIFMIRHRSMYLACALRKFVDEASKTSRWTWQQ